MSDEATIFHNCRECGAGGMIDKDQAEGRISIICEGCGAHYTLEHEGT